MGGWVGREGQESNCWRLCCDKRLELIQKTAAVSLGGWGGACAEREGEAKVRRRMGSSSPHPQLPCLPPPPHSPSLSVCLAVCTDPQLMPPAGERKNGSEWTDVKI